MSLYNVYCDESCHLENDKQKAMVIGAIWCPDNEKNNYYKQIRDIKVKHSIPKDFEIKWTKVSPAKLDFYIDLINFFFDSEDLQFRAVIVPDKSLLDHEAHDQTHDEWYYKIYFDMLKVILSPKHKYNIYLDIKDTQGSEKVKHLHDVICNSIYDFNREIVQKIQLVRSHEIEIIQLTDLLIGALSYANRELSTSSSKLEIIRRIKEKSGYSLLRSTLLRESKFNILRWHSRKISNA
ncbi:MAG: DUF3800 domain-containing protein [Candidatus Margulisiibacteriota bacterium]